MASKNPKPVSYGKKPRALWLAVLLFGCGVLLAAGLWRPGGEAGRERSLAAAARGAGTVSSKDTTMLAKVISGEARGEPYIGQVAVGAVIINRCNPSSFPNTVYGVIFEPGAFDAVRDGQYYQTPTASAVKAAKAAIGGWDPSNGAIYYWNPITATSKWIWSRPIIARIGNHVFAK
jgi:N-acetylmuramoyl-L-alanine amidase